MKQIARSACCLLALGLCLPLAAQSDDAAKDGEVITTDSMKERLEAAESDAAVITTTKMKERLETAPATGSVITNETLSGAAPAAAPGAFTNEHLAPKSDGDAPADGEAQATATAQTADAPDGERDRLIREIDAELDALATRVREIEGDGNETRLRETQAKLDELRRAVDALKKGE